MYVDNTGGKNEECCSGLSCGFIRSVEAEVGDSAGTCSDPFAVIVFSGGYSYAGQRDAFLSQKKYCRSGDTKKSTNVVQSSSSILSLWLNHPIKAHLPQD